MRTTTHPWPIENRCVSPRSPSRIVVFLIKDQRNQDSSQKASLDHGAGEKSYPFTARFRRADQQGSQRRVVDFTGTDPNDLGQRIDKDLSVTNRSGLGRGHDSLDGSI